MNDPAQRGDILAITIWTVAGVVWMLAHPARSWRLIVHGRPWYG